MLSRAIPAQKITTLPPYPRRGLRQGKRALVAEKKVALCLNVPGVDSYDGAQKQFPIAAKKTKFARSKA
jgi:hypothetical protein